MCVSSLRGGRADLLRTAPMSTDDPRRESDKRRFEIVFPARFVDVLAAWIFIEGFSISSIVIMIINIIIKISMCFIRISIISNIISIIVIIMITSLGGVVNNIINIVKGGGLAIKYNNKIIIIILYIYNIIYNINNNKIMIIII